MSNTPQFVRDELMTTDRSLWEAFHDATLVRVMSDSMARTAALIVGVTHLRDCA